MTSVVMSTSSLLANTSLINNSTDAHAADHSDIHMSLGSILLATVLGFCCLFVVLGNALVIAAVIREAALRTVTNYFIVSLAVADTCVGSLVMTLGATQVVLHGSWLFGSVWCDLWHSFDVLASTASILNLCVISLDRYWAIHDPFTYPHKMSERTAIVLIAFVWVCSALISFPAIAWWRAVANVSPADTCVFTDNLGYLAFSSIISFYGPLLFMIILYFRIYRTATEQMKCLQLGSKQVGDSQGRSEGVTLRIHRGGQSSKTEQSNTNPETQIRSENACMNREFSTNSESQPIRVHTRNPKSFSFSRKLAKFSKERKAAKTLGIVMGVFIVCWLPFFILNLLSGVCYDCISHPQLVLNIFTWLGWINSGMNPVIYACWSREFRRAFIGILRALCWRHSNPSTRLNRPHRNTQTCEL